MESERRGEEGGNAGRRRRTARFVLHGRQSNGIPRELYYDHGGQIRIDGPPEANHGLVIAGQVGDWCFEYQLRVGNFGKNPGTGDTCALHPPVVERKEDQDATERNKQCYDAHPTPGR